MKREFTVIIEQDEQRYFVGEVPELQGCHTQAKSLDELMERIKEVILLCLEAEGKKILTIEGLANGPTLHPVQKLFLDDSVYQCGFCTSGMIMAAVALLNKTPKPTRLQVKEAISGNLCWCGDYTRQVNTILKGGA